MDLEATCSATVVNIDDIPTACYSMTQPNSFKLCPLCNSEVKLFFINFNEKLLMCENTECEYPFGYEELQYFKEDSDKSSENEVMSIRESCSQTVTYAGSTACWSEIDKMHQVVDNDDMCSSFDQGALDVQEFMQSSIALAKTKTMQIKENIEKNVKEISNLTDTLSKTKGKRVKMLKNQNWIRNLSNLQKHTGAKFVKPIEIDLTPRDSKKTGEVSINIGPADNELSTLKIEIIND